MAETGAITTAARGTRGTEFSPTLGLGRLSLALPPNQVIFVQNELRELHPTTMSAARHSTSFFEFSFLIF